MDMKSTSTRRPFHWPLVISHTLALVAGFLLYQLPFWDSAIGAVASFWRGDDVAEGLHVLVRFHALEIAVVVGAIYLIARVRSRLALILGLLAFVYIVFWGVWTVSDMMTGVGINQSVVYHLFSGTEGADYSQFLKEFAVAVAFLSLAAGILLFSVHVGRRARRHSASGARFLPLALGCALIVSGWLLSPWHRDILVLADAYSGLDRQEAQRLEALYVDDAREIPTHKNLVVLYMESVESTYFNEALFPGLLPNLSRLRETSRYFSGIAQGPGAGWTIAGLVSSHCGVPLITPGADINDMGHMQRFLPEAKCLAEYLADNGFYTEYLGGASGKFAGKASFLRQHGFMTVKDRAFFQNEQPLPESDFSGWGVYDDTLLEMLYEEFVALSRRKEPFALFSLTMDTHPPHGHTPPRCEGLTYGDGTFKTLNSLYCTDRLVGEFIDKVKRSPYYADTTLVVLSDHLAMVNDAKNLLDQAERRENLLMLFDTSLAAGEQHVKGTTVDIGATLLDVLGASETRLGFGRSLLSPSEGDPAYSAAFFAEDNLNNYLSFSRQLWNMPSIAGRIYSNGQGSVVLGQSLVDAPFFSVLDSHNNVVEIYFSNFAEQFEGLKEGARYLYTLNCEATRDGESGVCLVSGLKGVGEKVFSSAELGQGVRASEIL